MKPIIARTFLIQNLLIALATVFSVVGLIFSAKIVTVMPSAFGSLTEGEVQVPLYLGIIPLPFLTYFLAFLFIYLIFEFYGFKPAFYTALNQGIALALCLAVLSVITHFTLDPLTSKYDETLAELLVYDKRPVLILILSFLSGNVVTLFLASLLKKLLRNYFMFIRFPISAFVGFAVCVGLSVYLHHFETLAPRSMLIYAVTPALQFLALIVLSVIPLYLLRLFLGIFRGWSQAEDNSDSEPKSLFKAPAVIPEQEVLDETYLQSPPPQEKLAKKA